ncbi:hypothetical protein PSHT_07410 [Puccinia striiformis]|uniref:Mitochondrial carrier protein n=3 Tax=Puccinia striiformis TaxID=27350 RepID=A0A0L0UX85_9BASI|nr:hypothetical protein KEM48_005557 [Puccinia striiformis f. sp. tritici PST-130]KNE91640.1 hypothetical protein PSTG_14948 [Puccinia striiformis f. sp. tritici PST-78]POW11606.1 hypothetical protein PSTT_05184 [Puccinia striiformis]POW14390.1 hypothetical protein PSHT_07410 [Puccinia striiformis]
MAPLQRSAKKLNPKTLKNSLANTVVLKLNAVGKKGSTKPTVGTIYKEIGFSGLWAGLGTRIVMVGTLTALQWLIYDYVKVAFGFPTTGSAEPEPHKR